MELDKQTLEQAKEAVENAFPEIFTKENVIDILDSIEQEEEEEEEEHDGNNHMGNRHSLRGGEGFELNGKTSPMVKSLLKKGTKVKESATMEGLSFHEKAELKDEVKEEVKEELREELKAELLDEMKDTLKEKVRDAISSMMLDDYLNKKETSFSVDEHNKITLDNVAFKEDELAKAIVEAIDFEYPYAR